MNPPPVSFELRDKYLLVVGHGRRDSLSSMAEASALIYAEIQKTNSQYILVDYRKLEINVHMSEAFNIVKRYEAVQPGLKQTTMAAVFEGEGKKFGTYWKEVGRQRGFIIEAFDDIAIAELWLYAQMSK